MAIQVKHLMMTTFTFVVDKVLYQVTFHPIKGGRSASETESNITVHKNGDELIDERTRGGYVNKTNAVRHLNRVLNG